MSRPHGSPLDLERCRKHAVAAIAAGYSRTAIGVHPNSVSRWVAAARTPGGLAAVPPPPPRSALADRQLFQLERLLLRGAQAHGWPNELWTAARVARLIATHFGIAYHPEHVRRILKQRLGWTSQKPRRKARDRDDAEVQRWLRDEFPRIVRETRARRARLVFLDESGFFLKPTVRRTFAPRGRTPVRAAWDRRNRLSAIRAIAPSLVRAKPNPAMHVLAGQVRAKAGRNRAEVCRRNDTSPNVPLTLLNRK
jgi:transposase